MTEQQLDDCMYDTMFLGNPESIVPTNDAQMTQHCSKMMTGIKCVKDYSDTCLTGFAKQMTGMVSDSLSKHLDTQCNQPKERAEFIENMKCFEPKEKMTPLHVCTDKHTKAMELVSLMNKGDPHMQFMCCAYQLFRRCITKEVTQICSVGHSQFWDEMFDEVASEAVTMACSDLNSVDKCSAKLDAAHWTQLKTLDEATDPSVWHHGARTPIKFMLEMIKKFN
ncbi:unnamed protein product [Medioppia subpectinata]|uniref:Uncharacterized protein n=1 Tax=Medioppia subpectinata TaxID=1979941 RepID=A0A7R9LHK5_9ACAR|nr:unnamed protein product [Medioppia subpectinata]CAG2118907.1 unnamed protein product [Medioppia subpectinata]